MPVAALILFGASALTQDASGNSRTFTGSIYGWGASIGVEAINGAYIDISLSDIVDNLDFAILRNLKAELGPSTFFSDVVYLNLGADENANRAPLNG